MLGTCWWILVSCTTALLKPAHSTRCAWRPLNLFPVCPFCFASKGVVVLLLSFICSKCHKTALETACGPYCSWAAADAIERTRYLDVFLLGLSCNGSPTVLWGHLSAGASRPTRDCNVKLLYAAMLLVQHKDMASLNLCGRGYSTCKFDQCNNLFNFVWLHGSTHIFHESLWEAAVWQKNNSTQVYSNEVNKNMLMLLLLLLNDVAACVKYLAKGYWMAFPETCCWNDLWDHLQ